jgi:predicted RNase H-like nuclease
VAALERSPEGLVVRELCCLKTDDELLSFVNRHAAETTVVLIDAPLVVPNETGGRACDRETAVRFRKQQAGAYLANRRRLGSYNGGKPRGEAIAETLVTRSASPLIGALPVGPGLRVLEVYPHPAMIVAFGLDVTLKYKKKRQPWSTARAELTRLYNHMRSLDKPRILHDEQGWESVRPTETLVGKSYKAIEDQLDALFCAWLGALALDGRLELIGIRADGAIAVPRGDAMSQREPARAEVR